MDFKSRLPAVATTRLTSYAPATAPLPPATAQAPGQAPGQGPADRKSSSSSSSSSSSGKREREASPERSPSPLARRAQPLTQAVGQSGSSYRSPEAACRGPHTPYAQPAAASSSSSTAAGALAAQPCSLMARMAQLPEPLITHIAAFAGQDMPLTFLRGLRQGLAGTHTSAISDTSFNTLLGLRPESLLELHPMLRQADDYRRYFAAGGTLAQIPMQERDEACCQMALDLDPRALEHVPMHWRSAQRCMDAVRRDGAMLAFVPPALLAPGSALRGRLCDAAFASPRAPRICHVPNDLLNPARYQAALVRLPLDFSDVPREQRTEAMCAAAIRATPEGAVPNLEAIPMRCRGIPVAEALMEFTNRGEGCWDFPEPAWFLPEALASEALQEILIRTEPMAYLTARGDVFTPEQIVSIVRRGSIELGYVGRMGELVTLMQRAGRASGRTLDQPVPDPSRVGEHALPNLSDEAIWRWVVREVPSSFRGAPAHIRGDYEIARAAVIGNPSNLRHVPIDTCVAHTDLLDRLLDQVGTASAWGWTNALPAEAWTRLDPARLQALCRRALHQVPESLKFLQQHAPHLLTDDIYALMAEKGCNLDLIPPRLQAALRESAIRNQGFNLAKLPDEERSLALCELAVANTFCALEAVPERHLSEALAARALERSPYALATVVRRFGNRLPDSFYLRAVTEGEALPDGLPPHLQSADLYRALVREAEDNLSLLVAAETPWMPALMLEMLAEDPSRINFLYDGNGRLEWAIHAHRHGADRRDVFESLSGLPNYFGDVQELMAVVEGFPLRHDVAGGLAAAEASDDEASDDEAEEAPGEAPRPGQALQAGDPR